MTDEQIIEKYHKLFRKMPPDMGAYHMRLDMMSQRKKYRGKIKNYEREQCSLIDVKRGLIVGSGICPHCNGWMGRAEYHED